MKMSKAKKELLVKFYTGEVLPAIIELKENHSTTATFAHAGVCPNLLFMLRGNDAKHIDHFKQMLNRINQNWPHFSGDTMYPIPAEWDHVTPRDYYLAGDLWSGKQLEMRLNLLHYLSIAVEAVIQFDALGDM